MCDSPASPWSTISWSLDGYSISIGSSHHSYNDTERDESLPSSPSPTPPTTRANPSPGKYSISDTAALHHANAGLTKKYIYLLKAGKPLPSDSKGGTPSALTGPEERALVTFIRSVESSAFAVSETSIRNYASFLRGHRFDNPQPPVSVSWVRRFKKRHPELQHKSPKVQEVTRAAAETDIQHIDNWFKEFDALMSTLGIQKCDLWNFDETPLQIGWVNGSLKLFSTRMKRNTRTTVFQPGNKESLTSIDAASAAGRSIPSFLILQAKTLLEEYTRANIDERVVLTFTDTGYNNSHRSVQWLQHFNRCSFAASETFAGSSIEEWFGYPTTITKSQFDEEYAFKPRYQVKKAPTSYRLLLMDSFSAHEDPEFIWYCGMFDIIPYRLPSHLSHRLQPLDVGVYQHLKNEQKCALRDFMIAGGMQISRFDFLNQWNRMYAAAFKACHIYVGYEKSGIFPINPEVVLGPLRRYAEERQKPLFPVTLNRDKVTPRRVKKQLSDLSVQRSISLLDTPTRKVIRSAEACVDLAIVTQKSHENVIRLQKERIRLEGRRTRSRRQIKGVKDGAFTVGELKRMVEAREEEQRRLESKKLTRQQNNFLHNLRDDGQPRLRGGAAVKAKKEKAAAEAAAMASQEADRQRIMSETEKETLENRRRLWIEGDEEKRDFQHRIWGRHVLEAIPEAADYLADLDKAAALREAAALRGQLDNIPEDVLSVSSRDLTPLLPGNEEEDCDDIEVIMNTQIEGFTQAALTAGSRDYSPGNSDQEEDLLRREDWGGFGYDRVPNNYSDDERVEACIVVAGMTIPVPPSRARD